jgi:hypothetical protein
MTGTDPHVSGHLEVETAKIRYPSPRSAAAAPAS